MKRTSKVQSKLGEGMRLLREDELDAVLGGVGGGNLWGAYVLPPSPLPIPYPNAFSVDQL
jgi:hypothetical protein